LAALTGGKLQEQWMDIGDAAKCRLRP